MSVRKKTFGGYKATIGNETKGHGSGSTPEDARKQAEASHREKLERKKERKN